MRKLVTASWSIYMMVCGSLALGDVVDFETIPGDVPQEGLYIGNQFRSTHGVSFRFANDQLPRLSQVGPPRTGFAGYPNDEGDDTPAPDQDIGQFFLTDDQDLSQPSAALLIEYVTPVGAAYGEILDIDGESTGQEGWDSFLWPGIQDEAWTIEALDASGATLESLVLTAGDPNTGDGMATPWRFDFDAPVVDTIRITYTGTKPSNYVGLGFDNFNPSQVPEPSSLALLCSAAISLGLGWWRRKGQTTAQPRGIRRSLL